MASRKYVIREGSNGVNLYGNNLAFYHCKDPEVMCAGGADTGKTFAMCLKVHMCACKYPNASIAIVRKTQTSCYSTILRTFMDKILGPDVADWPCVPYGGTNRTERFNYKNGSTVFVFGLDKPTRLLSGEFDLVAIPQAEEIPLSDWEILTTRTTGRAGKMPYSQTIGDCNPENPRHWILLRSADGGPLTRFESTHQDNPELYDQETGEITEAGLRRIGALDNLTGARKMRLRWGIWAAPEGAVFSALDDETHTVPAFDPPATWPRVVGIDPVGAYVAAVWLAFDPTNGILHAYREYYQGFGLTTAQHVDNVLKLSRRETIFKWICGAKSERQARLDWGAAGIPVDEPPYADLWSGIDKVQGLLQDKRLIIHDCCANLLSELGSYRRKKKGDDFVDQIENKGQGDHSVDAARYIIAWLCNPETGLNIVYNPVQIGRPW